MSIKEENICRLCLKVVNNESEKVDEVIKQMFCILLLKLDLDITNDPIICQGCVEEAKKCLDFKLICLGTERTILSFSSGRENIKYDIMDIYKENKDEAAVVEDLLVCRICITRIERNNFAFLDILRNETLMFATLPEYMPEIDFNIIQGPLICTTCRKNLEGYFKFVINCLYIEKKIKAYCKENDIDRINLRCVQNFRFKCISDCPEIYPIKEESGMFEDTECVYPENYNQLTKHEELDIKEECDNLEEKSYKNLPEMKINIYRSRDKKVVNSNKMYKCSLCAYETLNKGMLSRHMLVHKDVSQIHMHKCSLCTYETKWKNCLKNHSLVHKDVSEITMYKCSFCAYESKKKGGLKMHMEIHKDISEIKLHKCSLCAYETTQRKYLQNHSLVHKDVSEVPMYKCTLCVYATKHKYYLKRHMVVHKDVSETLVYECSFCAYETKQKGCLKINLLRHKDISELKMYKCALCTYEAKLKMYLKKHVLTHKKVAK